MVLYVHWNGGNDSIKGKHLPPTPCVRTGGGGLHYYFRAQGVPKKTALLPGMDLQGEGALAVAPPSIHPSGQCYQWAEGLRFGELEPAPLPEWVWQRISETQNQRSPDLSPSSETGRDTRLQVAQGRRHDALTKLVGHLLAKGLPAGEVRQLASGANEKYLPPLLQAEVEKIVESLAKKEASKAKPKPERAQYEGDFEGLAEIVELKAGPLSCSVSRTEAQG